jgi:hypothetical protein
MDYHCKFCHLILTDDIQNLFAKGTKSRCKLCDSNRKKASNEKWKLRCELNKSTCALCKHLCDIIQTTTQDSDSDDHVSDTLPSDKKILKSKVPSVKASAVETIDHSDVLENPEDLKLLYEFSADLKSKGKKFSDLITDISLYMKAKKTEEENLSIQNTLRSSYRQTETEYRKKIDDITSKLTSFEIEIKESLEFIDDFSDTIKPDVIVDTVEKLEYCQQKLDDYQTSSDKKFLDLESQVKALSLENRKLANSNKKLTSENAEIKAQLEQYEGVFEMLNGRIEALETRA